MSVGEKREIIEKVREKQWSRADVAAKYEVSIRSISRTLKNEGVIMNHNISPARKKLLAVETNPLDAKVFSAFVALRRLGFPVSCELLREIALFHANLMGNIEFAASRNWIRRFTKDYQIKKYRLNGVSASLDDSKVREARSELKDAIEKSGIPLEDVYNMDETAFFYECLPDKTLDFRSPHGVMASKLRITLVACCNVTGSVKLPLLFIGKSKSPFCLRTEDCQGLRGQYISHKSAWMTVESFNKWLVEFDRGRERPSLLILDQAPVHKLAEGTILRKTRLLFLPPKMTSVLQPLDAGVIHALKSHYRKELVRKIVKQVNEVGYQDISPTQLKNIKTTTLATAMTMMNQVWSDFNAQTMKNCWSHCQILPDSMQSEVLGRGMNDIEAELTESNNYISGLDTLAKAAAQFSKETLHFIPMVLLLENETQSCEEMAPTEERPSEEEEMVTSNSTSYEEKLVKEIRSKLGQVKDCILSNPRDHEIFNKTVTRFALEKNLSSFSPPSKTS